MHLNKNTNIFKDPDILHSHFHHFLVYILLVVSCATLHIAKNKFSSRMLVSTYVYFITLKLQSYMFMVKKETKLKILSKWNRVFTDDQLSWLFIMKVFEYVFHIASCKNGSLQILTSITMTLRETFGFPMCCSIPLVSILKCIIHDNMNTYVKHKLNQTFWL